MRLLLVEDDPELRQSLGKGLRERGYAVDEASSGDEAWFMGETEPYDLIVLDLGLPEVPGLKVLQHWRRAGIITPVLILTARGAWHEKVEGFRAGADDYLTKPFHFEELVVRLQALGRRMRGFGSPVLEIGALKLDEGSQKASWSGKEIDLTGTEFRLLRYLMLHPDKVFSASHLVEHVYDFNEEKESNVIEVYISRLRRKLGHDVIGTRRGQGYFLRSEVLRSHR